MAARQTKKESTSQGQSSRTGGTASRSGPEILTFALEKRPKATRAGLPKSRSGCITCKKRHVKCDEAKPSCRRCMKWQGFCEGYGSQPLKRPEAPSSAKGKGSASSQSSTQGSISGGQTSASTSASSSESPPSSCESDDRLIPIRKPAEGWLREPSASFLASESERLYFDNWLNVAGGLGGRWFTSRMWTHTIPALSRDEPAVRYAAMAIGAMAQASYVDGKLPQLPRRGLSTTDTHYSNALAYYGKSLGMLRTQVAQRQDSASRLRAAALTCILYTSFELMHGNRGAAMSHIAHGLRMVEGFIRSHSSTKSLPMPDESQQQPQKRQPKIQPTGKQEVPGLTDIYDSPAPLILEDEIVQTFQRLDFQAWSTGLLRPQRHNHYSSVYSTLGKGINSHLEAAASIPIPKSFAGLEDARRYFAVVQQRVLQFPRHAVATLGAMHKAGGEYSGGHADLDLCDVPSVKEAQQKSIDVLEEWARAFAPIYAATRLDKRVVTGGEEMYPRAASLRLQYLFCWMAMRSIAFTDYKTIYLMTPQFREIVQLCKILLPKQQERFNQHQAAGGGSGDPGDLFTIDNGPTLALFLTAVKARNEELRNEAIKLLDAYPRRDGFWDSRFCGAISWRNIPCELEIEQDGDLAEQWAKLRLREGIFDERGNGEGVPRLVMYAPRKNPATGEFFIWKTSMTLDELEDCSAS